jgi:hypothetical protein
MIDVYRYFAVDRDRQVVEISREQYEHENKLREQRKQEGSDGVPRPLGRPWKSPKATKRKSRQATAKP